MLHENKNNAIFLDEPDSLMDADYINDILLNVVKYSADNNKIIVISTHNPNLVIRTHAYMYLFRENR